MLQQYNVFGNKWKIENLTKEIKIIKKKPMEIKELDNITKMKNLLYKLNSRVDITENGLREFETEQQN